MIKIFNRLLYLLPTNEKSRAISLLILTFFMAFIDMLGIVSIVPFVTVLTNPTIIEKNFILKKLFLSSTIFGVETQNQFLILLGIMVMSILLISLSFKAFTMYLQSRLAAKCQYKISKQFVEAYLNQPYAWVLSRHSADIGKTVLSEVGTIVSKGLVPMMSLITQSTIFCLIIIMLIFINPMIALIIGSTFSLAYLIIYKIVKNLLTQLGQERLKANELRFTTVIDAFGAFKEVKIGGLENTFVKKFSKYAKTFANHESLVQIIGILPRFFMEAVAFGLMLLIVLYFLKQNNNAAEIIPLIALYAFAGYRLMPAIQLLYINATHLRAVGPSLESLYEDLRSLKSLNTFETKDTIQLNRVIKLNNIYYQYPNTSKETLNNINLSIPVNSVVGFIGVTGSGKTTVVDIILGLLQAQRGSLEVDGKIINNSNLRSWQKSIGYVPQQIYLINDTVATNIAFGVSPEDIKQEQIERVCKVANLHEFVENELPMKYQTNLGERGVRLSGGQRQRIGIARALYNNPKVLILDEATSSLDNLTEKSVMKEIQKLGKDMTIILIAHRLDTIKNCDIVYIFENGKIKDQGKFQELVKKNDLFIKNKKKNPS